MTLGPDDPAVTYARDGAIGTITLNRPDNRNSMTPELLDAFALAVQAARADALARVVIVTGRGTCFSAGADFKSIIQRDSDGPPRVPSERSMAMYEPFLMVRDIEVPVIGALNGHTVGGGFGLALACDLRIGAADAKYGANFARLGLHPGMAISYVLPRLIGVARAAELLFTGRLIDGTTAATYGILNEAVPATEVNTAARALAEEIAASAPIAVRLMKRSLYRFVDWRPEEAAALEAFAQAETLATADAREGIDALLGKRPPHFTGR